MKRRDFLRGLLAVPAVAAAAVAMDACDEDQEKIVDDPVDEKEYLIEISWGSPYVHTSTSSTVPQSYTWTITSSNASEEFIEHLTKGAKQAWVKA